MDWETNRRTFLHGTAAVLASSVLPGQAATGISSKYDDMLIIDALSPATRSKI